MKLVYPATFEKDGKYILVQFPDIPEAITQGATIEEAYEMSEEVLGLALEDKKIFPLRMLPSLNGWLIWHQRRTSIFLKH